MLLVAVHKREDRRTQLQAELAALDGMTLAQFDAVRVEEGLRRHLDDWLSLASRHPAQTQKILGSWCSTAFEAGVRPNEEKRYHYEGNAAVDRFFSELVRVNDHGVPNGIFQRGNQSPDLPN